MLGKNIENTAGRDTLRGTGGIDLIDGRSGHDTIKSLEEMMSSLVDPVTNTASKAVRVMMPFMATVVMTPSLLEKEMTPFGVEVVTTLLPVQLEPMTLPLTPDQVTIPLMFLLSTAQSLPARVMTPSMF